MMKYPNLRFFQSLLAFLFLLAVSSVQAQVFEGDLELDTQPEVDAFDYTEITGNLFIRDTDIINLDSLISLTTVGASFEIKNNHALTNVDGLANLNSVGVDLIISDNSMLNACSCGLRPILNSRGIMRHLILDNNLPGCNFISEIIRTPCETNTPTEDDNTNLPHRFTLEANYPNPFNPTTTLRFGLPQAQRVRLVVYDALGREVAVLIDRELSAGWHTATFEAGNLASGVYLAWLRAGDRVETQRMILLK